MGNSGPWFSLIIPSFNREREIARALDSCLMQVFTDFEVVVTDGNSSDRTREVVVSYGKSDNRIKLLVDPENRGICPARNMSIRAARGRWMVMLDSDMALLPDALSALFQLTTEAKSDVGNLATTLVWDTGISTPTPRPSAAIFDYSQYVAWTEQSQIGEYFNCIRNSVFERGIYYPNSKAYEGGFHLDLAKHWKFQFCDIPIAKYYTDAPNRNSAPRSWRLMRTILERSAHDLVLESDRVLLEHGDVLMAQAPRRYAALLLYAMTNALIDGERRDGIRYWRRYLSRGNKYGKSTIALALGMAHRRLLSTIMARLA
jgi:glycosyltransferase involved in cell wall biosynthesis